MKTRSLSRFMPVFALAMFAGSMAGGSMREHGQYFGSPVYIPRHGRFKGYMRENRKCTFNKNK